MLRWKCVKPYAAPRMRMKKARGLVLLGCGLSMAMISACELIAGIEEKTAAPGMAGSSSSGVAASGGGFGGGSSSSGGGMGGGMGGALPQQPINDPSCGPGIPPDMTCLNSPCNPDVFASSPCHCGTCDHSCGGPFCGGGTCAPQLISELEPNIHRIATNGKRLFFSSHASGDFDGKLYSVPLELGQFSNRVTHTNEPMFAIRQVAASCNFVFYGVLDTVALKSRLKLLPIDNPAQVPPLILSEDPGDITDIVVDGQTAYWVHRTDDEKGSIYMWNEGDAAGKEILSNLRRPYGLAVDSAYLFYGLDSSADGAKDGHIMKIPKPMPNGPIDPMVVAENVGRPWGLAVDFTHVYWLDGLTEEVMPMMFEVRVQRASKGASPAANPPQVVSTIQGSAKAHSIAVDGKYIYWSSSSDIMRKSTANIAGPATVVLDGYKYPNYSANWFVADRHRLYATRTDATASVLSWVGK